MRPSPFTGKFKKKQIKIQKDKNQQKPDQNFDEPVPTHNDNTSLRPPSTKNMIKIGKSKQREKSKQPQKDKQQQNKKIYDALKQDDNQKLQSKASATFKPNLKLLKGGKKLKLSTHQEQKKQEDSPQQPQQQSYRPVLKPNLFKKGDTIASERGHNKEEVVVEEVDRYYQNQNKNIEEDSQEGSQSMSIAPKFKIKNKIQNQQFPVIQQQQFQTTGFNVNNFADIKLQTRQINLDPSQTKISSSKLQKQQARIAQLTKLLNLQQDLYQQTLNIGSTTGYQNYINKIKSGTLINSCDQAFDQKMTSGTQTSVLEYEEFMNQCPQDYYMDVEMMMAGGGGADGGGVGGGEDSFGSFVSKLAPVFEELIKPSSSVVMPPIFLLALRPSFRKFVCCPFPVFVYFSETLKVGIVVIGEKLYIVEAEVESVLSMGSILIVGCQNGGIYVWGGKNDKRSRLYRRILQQTQTTNFQLPQCSNQQLDRFSIYKSHFPIIQLHQQSPDQFTSLDASSKLTKWRIIRTSSSTSSSSSSLSIQPMVSHQFSNILQRSNLISYCFKKRNQMYFVGTSVGILVWNGEEIVQKLDTEGFRVNGFALPYRTGFVYTVLQDSTMRIYHQNYANQLYKVHLSTPTSTTLTDIHIPQTQYQNKKLSLTSKAYITTSQSQIYKINFLQPTPLPKLITATPSQKERDIIYKGINRLNHCFEIVSLWKDLRCTTEVKKIDVNVEGTVGNVKNILEENRLMHNWLEEETAVLVVE